MPDVKWYSGDSITINNTRVIGGTSNRLLRNDGSRVQNSLLSDDGTDVTLASGQLLGPAGTALLPTYSFASAPSYGTWLRSGVAYDISIAGVNSFDFQAASLTIRSGASIQWPATDDAGNAPDTVIRRAAAANLGLGAAAANPPVAQTLSTQGASGTDIAGANFTVDVSPGTGTGAGGSFIVRTAAAGGTGSSQNALAAALTIPASPYLIITGVSGAGGTPTTSQLTAGSAVAAYIQQAHDGQATKYIIAYNNYNGLTYISIPLDGSTATWTHSQTRP